jgi:putative ABC transport system permease protein
MNSFPPFSGLGAATGVHILSQPARSLMDLPDAEVRVVGPDYFHTLEIPLRAGRTFNEQELAEARHVVIVNQVFVDKYMSGFNPVGQRAVIFMKSLEESQNTPSEIIGVVGDVRQMGLDTPGEPTVYWPHPELVYSGMTILVRTSNDPLALVSAARNELQQMDPEQPMAAVATMEQLLGDSLARSRFTMLVLAVFAAIAVLLASVGIYGVIAYGVAQRTQEFGIRIALGAGRRDVLRLVLGQGARLALLGIGLGAIFALMLTKSLATLLYGISPTDPLTFVGVAFLLGFDALAACYVPAQRATRVDPIETLRYE